MQRVVRSSLLCLLTLASLAACASTAVREPDRITAQGVSPQEIHQGSLMAPLSVAAGQVSNGEFAPIAAPAGSLQRLASMDSVCDTARVAHRDTVSAMPVAIAAAGLRVPQSTLAGRTSRDSLPPRQPFRPAQLLLVGIGMTALAGERMTNRRSGQDVSYPVAAGVKCYAGGLAVISGGYVRPGTTATGRTAVGRFRETVDNTSGASGDVNVQIERGTFQFANSAAADAITLSHVGSLCYIVDDQTVARTDGAGTRSVAGIVRDVDNGGVWVEVCPDAHGTRGAVKPYTKVDVGVKTLLAADAGKDRAVLITVTVDEVFANGTGAQTTFKIGETGSDAKFAAAAAFTGLAAGTVKQYAGILSAGKDLIVTATAATGTGTGGVTVAVVGAPTT